MHEVHVLHNLVNQVRFWELDLTVEDGINVNAYIVVKGSLIFNVKNGPDLRDCIDGCCIV